MFQKKSPGRFVSDSCNYEVGSQNLEGSCKLIRQTDWFDCQLAWEYQWREAELQQIHILVLGGYPFLEGVAADRIRRHKIPMLQRFCLPGNGKAFPDYRVPGKDTFVELGGKDCLEIVGQLVNEDLFILFQLGKKWDYEFWGPAALANYLKQTGLHRIGTLYLIASRAGAGNFLPTLGRELTCRGIGWGSLCGPQDIVHPEHHSMMILRRKIRVISEAKMGSFSSAAEGNLGLGPMLREEGPEFAYEVIVQAEEDPAVAEAIGILLGNSPFRTCWMKWNPSKESWQVLYGEPRFLRLNTRWVVVAQSTSRVRGGLADLFAGLEVRQFAVRFLRLLHAFEGWQEIHGKLTHLLLVGGGLFKRNEKGGFASKLAYEFAALGRRIRIRVRDFVQQKDIVGCLHAGQLAIDSPFLKWTFGHPVWERDLDWGMGDLTMTDAPVNEPEARFRRARWLPSSAWQIALESDLEWILGIATVRRWRESIRLAMAEVFSTELDCLYHSCRLVPILEAAALGGDSNLLWLDADNGEVLQLGTCPSCLREFESYFQNISQKLFAAFFIDGDFCVQRQIGVSSHLYEPASLAALYLFYLVHPEEDSLDSFQIGLSVRLCSEFLKNLGDRTPGKEGIVARACRAASRDYGIALLSVAHLRRAIFSILPITANPDKYEMGRAYQFSASSIKTFPPALCWQDFLDPIPISRRLLGNACENLSMPSTNSEKKLEWQEIEEYFKKIEAAQKKSTGSFQTDSEGILWTPPPFVVILEIDLRTSWICFGTHFLYSSTHQGTEDMNDKGMPFVQVNHAAQLPTPVWSKPLALNLWQLLGGSFREQLPTKPDSVILPLIPTAFVSYEWGAYHAESSFSPGDAFKKIVQTGRFHPIYREFDCWHVIQGLQFDTLPTLIEVFLDVSTKRLIFPDPGGPSQIRYRIYGAGGKYRCLVRRGFIAEIECQDASESWTFESADGTLLTAGPGCVQGDGVAIRFLGSFPRNISINTEVSSTPLIRATSAMVLPWKYYDLPGIPLGNFGDFHVRFDTRMGLLRTFCPNSFRCLGPLKTIYAQVAHRFDRVAVHDGSCFAVEHLLSSSGNCLEFTYRLNTSGWALIVICTDLVSFLSELKVARRIKCPLDEFLLRWLNAEEVLGTGEEEEEGILPQLADVVFVCSKSMSSLPSFWIRTSDHSVIWQGNHSEENVQAVLTLLGEEMRFLFQRGKQAFFKEQWDAWMFSVSEGAPLHHLVRGQRWILSAQDVWSLGVIPLHIGWKLAASISEKDVSDLFSLLGYKLRHPMLGFMVSGVPLHSQKLVFIDLTEKVGFRVGSIESESWFLGREVYGGFAYWWLPQDKQVVGFPPLSIASALGCQSEIEALSVQPPFRQVPTGASIADGFLHLCAHNGDIYRRTSDGFWQIMRVFCSGISQAEMLCEIANAVCPKDSVPILPLEIAGTNGRKHIGWFLSQTLQIVEAPVEAGNEAILLGCSSDGENHYIFGENKIFEVSDTAWRCYGKALFALRKNDILVLGIHYIADPPILDAQKIILIGSTQCMRWKLGAGLRYYQLILLESCSGTAISGILDLRPLCVQDCGCWVDGEDVIIAELTTGNRLTIRGGRSVISSGYFSRGIQIRFAEAENCLSLQALLSMDGNYSEIPIK